MNVKRHALWLAGTMWLATWSWTGAEEPLHARIDARIAERWQGIPVAERCDDATFIRRVYLDLAGVIPTADETRRFLADSDPEKRVKLIDRLLEAPTYAERMRELFHVMLMERRGDDESWDRFLREAFRRNLKWDEMARLMLHPPDDDEALRGAAFFYTKRLESYGQNPVDYPGLTRDVGRLLLGIDLQCAQCHDHLFVSDYKQREFQGLFVIYQNLSIRSGTKFPAINEKPIKEPLQFVSVFDPTPRTTGPRVPFGAELTVNDPADAKVGTATRVLAEELTRPDNTLFTENMANRLWCVMMGRGLVHPLDLFHSDNPPSHPELLAELGRAFAAHQFDIRWFLRELALSETYQRSSILPDAAHPPPPELYAVALERRLSAEQLLASLLRAAGEEGRLAARDSDGKPTQDWEDLRNRFVAAFANEPREPEIEFHATVKAALFLLNDEKVLALLRPHDNNLSQRLLAAGDAEQLADELYHGVLCRPPASEERQEVAEFLRRHAANREMAVRSLQWALMTSMEFCVNH